MRMPFIYGKLAYKTDFTDRKYELERLVTNFRSQINTILISPRRWGKSSLVSKAAQQLVRRDKTYNACIVDMYNIRSETEFYAVLAREVLKSTSTKAGEVLKNAEMFIKRIVPRISFSPGGDSEFKVSFDLEAVKKEPDEILDLAENIAKAKGVKYIICIDEFQNIAEFDEPLSFQKKLRSHWQKHENVSYCLYGSKRHMMTEVFANPSMPFYKFGDLIFLNKIEKKEWIRFITRRFKQTGKKISSKNASLIAELAECHPYYVQQLAQQVWLRTNGQLDEQVVPEAQESIVLQLSMLFQNATNELSRTQVNFLKAMLDGVQHYTAQNVLKEYNLGSSANVSIIKNALEKKEVIDNFEGDYQMLDPMYKYCLKNFYFRD